MERRRFLKSAGASAAAILGLSVRGEAQEKDEDTAPSFPIVDTHVHFWDTGHLDYPWVKSSKLLNRPYLPRDFDKAAGAVEVERIVFVEAACATGQEMAEVEWVSELAKEDPRIQGIVANAPIEQGDAVLPILEELAANPLVKGIRRFLPGGVQEVPSGFVQGVQHLERVGLSFDLGGGRGLLPAATKLVQQCPNVQFILNHIGVPDIENQALVPWRKEISALAKLPNVCCKMSGVATGADREHWTREDIEPALEHVIDCFGFERTAFGSDWPVMLSATTYSRWASAATWAVRGCSQVELRRLFRDTAIGFYRLGSAGGERD